MNTTITGIRSLGFHEWTKSRLQMVLVILLLGLFGVPIIAQGDESSTSNPSGSEDEETYFSYLQQKARTGSIADRALAMQKLGRIGFPDALPVLEEGLQHENKRIRLTALDAIGNVEHPSANQHLKEAMFREDPVLSARAAEWVSKRSPAFGVPLLLDGMDHASKVIRSGSFAALEQWTGFRFGYHSVQDAEDRTPSLDRWRHWWRNNRDRSEEEWWRSHIRRTETDQRSVASIVAATARLTERKCWSCVPELIGLLDHPRGPVRTEALHGLRQITMYRLAGTDDPQHEVAERVQSRWRKWWDAYGAMSRGRWLIDQFIVHASMEEVPIVLVLPNRIEQIVRELSDPELNLSPSLLRDLLENTGNRRMHAVRILRQRTGFSFGTFRTEEEVERENVFQRWREWLREWGDQPREKRMLHMIEHGKRAHNRNVAARYFERHRSNSGVQALIRFGLRDPKQSVREAAITSLTYSTGRRLGYRAEASESERKEMVKRWVEWWEGQDDFFERRLK